MALARELPHSFEEALKAARQILSSNTELVSRGVIDAEAEQIVMAAYRISMGKSISRLQLYVRAGDRFPEQAGQTVVIFSHARAEGKLLQHLTGSQAFLEHDYEVTPSVLIPRPETELLVRLAIETLDRARKPRLGLEVGAGSGVIAIELLCKYPELVMHASEVSPQARACALANAQSILGQGAARLELEHVTSASEVLEPFGPALAGRKADFLISNPPYLTREDPIESEVAGQEPALALFAPAGDPLYFYRAIASGAGSLLAPGGLVFLELAHERARAALELFTKAGWNAKVLRDLNERERYLIAEGAR